MTLSGKKKKKREGGAVEWEVEFSYSSQNERWRTSKRHKKKKKNNAASAVIQGKHTSV